MESQHWENNAKIAVMVTLMLETWSEGKAPSYSSMTTPLKPGTLDTQGISWSEYGGRTGIWRIMRILDEFGIKATVCASGRSVELFPEAVKEVARKGHEVAGHSYTQDMLLCYLSLEEERNVIRKCCGLIEGATGAKPVGWLSPRGTPTEHTAELLAEEGFLWHGDHNDVDLPYVVDTAKGPLVAIPQSNFADNRVLRGNPRDYFQVYKDTFDYLYNTEPIGVVNLTVHSHWGGRPLMSAIIREVLKYIKGFSHVWFAGHDDVARWVMNHPVTSHR